MQCASLEFQASSLPLFAEQAGLSPTSWSASQKTKALIITVKFLNFRTSKKFAVIYLKFKQRGETLGIPQKDANGKANSADPDQTALGAV